MDRSQISMPIRTSQEDNDQSIYRGLVEIQLINGKQSLGRDSPASRKDT